MARNPVAKSLRSSHLQGRVVPDKRRSDKALRERLQDWPDDPLGEWHGINE